MAARLVFSARAHETCSPCVGVALIGLAAFARESVTPLSQPILRAPFVTVLIDTYDYAQFIEQAVEIALAQDFPREQREILVVDDGSTDDTAELLKKFGDEIRYLRKTNGGQASAFNLCFAEAHGEILATLDADDLWLPDKRRSVCETFEKNPGVGMVYHRTYMWRGGEELSNDTYFADVSGRIPDNRASL